MQFLEPLEFLEFLAHLEVPELLESLEVPELLESIEFLEPLELLESLDFAGLLDKTVHEICLHFHDFCWLSVLYVKTDNPHTEVFFTFWQQLL